MKETFYSFHSWGTVLPLSSWRKGKHWPAHVYFVPLGSTGTFQAVVVHQINTYLDNLWNASHSLKSKPSSWYVRLTYKMAFESCTISSLWLLLSCPLRKEKEERLKYWLVFCDCGFFPENFAAVGGILKSIPKALYFSSISVKSLIFLK